MRTLVSGDELFLARDPSIEFVFKFYGHRGVIIASRVVSVPGRPDDVIGRQKDFIVQARHGHTDNRSD